MGQYDAALANAISSSDFSGLELLQKSKVHVKTYWRKDPDTGKLTLVHEHEAEHAGAHLKIESGHKIKITQGSHAGKTGTIKGYDSDKKNFRAELDDKTKSGWKVDSFEHADPEEGKAEWLKEQEKAEAEAAQKVEEEAKKKVQSKKTEKLQDFGEKIGGAKKDLWGKYIAPSDLKNLNEKEAYEYIAKDNIWPKIDYKALVDGGMSVGTAYTIKTIRDAVSSKPAYESLWAYGGKDNPESIKKVQEVYVEMVGRLRDELAKVKEAEDFKGLFDRISEGYYEKGSGWLKEKGGSGVYYAIGKNALKKMQVSNWDLKKNEQKAIKTGWPTPQKKEAGEIKKNNDPVRPQLANIVREGKDYRGGADVTTKQFQLTFGFRGGEFGNWNTKGDRQQVLNHAYDALLDLADSLGLPPKAISLNGQLGIGFGSRGHGGKNAAMAHYEPNKVVINLTKMSGAGSLSHEWFHALDDYFGKQSGDRALDEPYASAGGFKAHSKLRPEMIQAWDSLMDGIKRRTATKEEHLADEDEKIAKHSKWFKGWAASVAMHLDGAERKQFEAKLDELVSQPKNPPSLNHAHNEVEKLSSFVKEWTGKKIPADIKNGMEGNLSTVLDGHEHKIQIEEGGATKKWVSTDFLKNAAKIDEARSKSYWATKVELAARAFEGYAYDKIKEDGKQSDFLVHSVTNSAYSEHKPYAEGEDRNVFKQLFDKFFSTMEHVETEKGTILLKSISHYVWA